MSDFISDIDQAKLYVQFVFRPLAQCSFIEVLIYMNNTKSGGWVVAYESLKTKVQLGKPEGGCGRIQEWSLLHFSWISITDLKY